MPLFVNSGPVVPSIVICRPPRSSVRTPVLLIVKLLIAAVFALRVMVCPAAMVTVSAAVGAPAPVQPLHTPLAAFQLPLAMEVQVASEASIHCLGSTHVWFEVDVFISAGPSKKR